MSLWRVTKDMRLTYAALELSGSFLTHNSNGGVPCLALRFLFSNPCIFGDGIVQPCRVIPLKLVSLFKLCLEI